MNISNCTTKLAAPRRCSYSLSHLSDIVRIPAHAGVRNEAIKTATLDDIAFALLGLQEQSSEIHREIESLRAIYEIDRKSGAVGAEIAFDVVPDAKGGSR